MADETKDIAESSPPPPAPAPAPMSPPPNGGTTAWLQVLSCFWLWFVVWGLVNSFGVFQAYYETDALKNHSSSDISWIGSLQLAIFILGTVVVGPLYDLGYLEALLIVGGFLTVFGMMMTSLCTRYFEFILAQGVCMGLGMTCLFTPSIALIPPYFSTKRGLAAGLSATGSSIGAIIIAIVFQQLVPKVGFGWATRVIGFILLFAMVPPILVSKKRVAKAPPRALLDMSALKEPPFLLFAGCMFFTFIGLYIPFFYIQVFSEVRNVLAPNHLNLNAYLVVFLNVGSFFGRIFPNMAADKIGALNAQTPCTLLCAVLAFAWIAVYNLGGEVVFTLFYGFFSGAFVSLTPVIWAGLCPHPRVMGTRSGMMCIPMGIGLLIGNPIGGALIKGTRFYPLQIWCGVTVIIAAVFSGAARFAITGPKLLGKA